MAFCFRIRLELGERIRIHSDETELALPGLRDGEEVVLRPTTAGTALKDAQELVLLGPRYENADDAAAAAGRLRDLAQKAFARVYLGADFGDRAPQSALTKQGQEYFSAQIGRRVLNDLHGTQVYECDPQPVFGGFSAKGIKGVPPERVVKAMDAAIELDAVMSERDQLAYDLFGASFFETSADARLITLMMAVETMVVPEERAD